MRKYTFEIVVEEGNDEFWESLKGSGCDEVQAVVAEALESNGFMPENTTVRLVTFQNVSE